MAGPFIINSSSSSGLVHYDMLKREWYDVPEEPRVWDNVIRRWVQAKENPASGATESGAQINEFGEVSP